MLAAAPAAPALPSPAPDGDACLIALLDARLCAFEAEFGRLNPLVGIAVAQHAMTGISGAQSEAISAWAGAVAEERAAAYAGHSLRSGLATSAAANDAPGHAIQRQLRHRKFDTTAGYIRAGQLFKQNAAGMAGL